MKKILLFITALAMLSISNIVLADAYSDTIKTFKNSDVVKNYFSKAYGYAVFPTIGKGGVGIGAAHGEGQVYRKGKVTGKTSMTQITIGLQLGGQAYSQVIFFEDKRAYKDFTSGNFEFGAQATAIAITSSASAQSGTTGTSAGAGNEQTKSGYTKGMIVFTHGKGGLMYEATIGGQKYSFKTNK